MVCEGDVLQHNGAVLAKSDMAAVVVVELNGKSLNGHGPIRKDVSGAKCVTPSDTCVSEAAAQGSPSPDAETQREEHGRSVLQDIFSWRGAIFTLLHISFITLNLPRSSTNMVIVCINEKRKQMIELANASGLELADNKLYEMTMAGNDSIASYSRNQLVWEAYENVMNDINWDSTTKGLILSGPHFLSCVGPIVFDIIRQKFGSRLIMACTLIVNATLMFTSPVLARTSSFLLLANQVVIGFALGGNVPCVGSVIPRWSPDKQRLTATAVVFAGMNMGAIISSLANGFLCSIPVDNGWPFIYYTSGTALVIFSVAWFFLMSDSPETHPYISEQEKSYILSTRSKALGDQTGEKNKRPPYRAFLTSVPVLAYMSTFCCFLWTMSVLVVYNPIYLNTVLGFSPQMTGVLFAAIACTRVTGSLAWTALGNFLTNRGLLTQATTRKTCICIGMGLASGSCLAVSLFDRDNKWAAIATIALTMFLQAVCSSHVSSLPMDLAPRYSGTLMSISMSVALLVALSGPLTVGKLTPTGSYSEWRTVWYILSAVFLSSSIIFLTFGQATLQPWAIAEPVHSGDSIGDLELQSVPTSSEPSESSSLPAVKKNQLSAATSSQSRCEKATRENPPTRTLSSELAKDNFAFEEDVSVRSVPEKSKDTVSVSDSDDRGASSDHENIIENKSAHVLKNRNELQEYRENETAGTVSFPQVTLLTSKDGHFIPEVESTKL